MFQGLGPLLGLFGRRQLDEAASVFTEGAVRLKTDGLKGEYHADRIGASAGSDQSARYVVDHRRALAVR